MKPDQTNKFDFHSQAQPVKYMAYPELGLLFQIHSD